MSYRRPHVKNHRNYSTEWKHNVVWIKTLVKKFFSPLQISLFLILWVRSSRKVWHLITIFDIHSPFILPSFFRRVENGGKKTKSWSKVMPFCSIFELIRFRDRLCRDTMVIIKVVSTNVIWLNYVFIHKLLFLMKIFVIVDRILESLLYYVMFILLSWMPFVYQKALIQISHQYFLLQNNFYEFTKRNHNLER